MRIHRFLRLGLSLLLAVVAVRVSMADVGAAKEQKPVVEMHRQGVSEKDANGWYPADSTLGGFSVLMPIPFNDFSISSRRTDGSPLRMDCLGGRTADGVKFMVSGGPWFLKKPQLKDLYEGFQKGGEALSPPKYLDQGEVSSVTFEVAQKEKGAWIRYTVTPSMIFSATLEYPIDQREKLAHQAETFLDSLKIKQPEHLFKSFPDAGQTANTIKR